MSLEIVGMRATPPGGSGTLYWDGPSTAGVMRRARNLHDVPRKGLDSPAQGGRLRIAGSVQQLARLTWARDRPDVGRQAATCGPGATHSKGSGSLVLPAA